MSPWLGMAAILAVLAGLLAALRAARRRGALAPEPARKALHVTMGLVALGLPALFASPGPVLGLAAGFVVLLAGRRVSAAVDGWLREVVDAGRPESLGPASFPLAVALIFLWAARDPARFAVPILALALADPAAGLCGARWGRLRYTRLPGGKSVEGSLACGAVAAGAAGPVLIVLAGAPWLEALLTAAAVGASVAAIEALAPGGLDNLLVPLGALAVLDGLDGLGPGGRGLAAALAGLVLAGVVAVARPARTAGDPRGRG